MCECNGCCRACRGCKALQPPQRVPDADHGRLQNNKDYFDQSLDEIKLLRYINDNDPADEHGVLRLYEYFYYKARSDGFRCLPETLAETGKFMQATAIAVAIRGWCRVVARASASFASQRLCSAHERLARHVMVYAGAPHLGDGAAAGQPVRVSALHPRRWRTSVLHTSPRAADSQPGAPKSDNSDPDAAPHLPSTLTLTWTLSDHQHCCILHKNSDNGVLTYEVCRDTFGCLRHPLPSRGGQVSRSTM